MQKNYIVYLVAMRHHDFKDDLPSLYKRVIGQVVTLRKEDDNAWDVGKAVAAYFEYRLMAYVSTDQAKMMVRQILDSMGRSQLKCKVTKFLKARCASESDMLVAEILNCEGCGSTFGACNLTDDDAIDWSLWMWDGPTLPQSKEENQLQAIVDDIHESLRTGEPWSENIQMGLDMMGDLMWADLSRGTRSKYNDILKLLSADDNQEMANAADSLTQKMAHVGSPEMRDRVYACLLERAKSEEVADIIEREGYTLESLSKRIPTQLVQLFCTDTHKFVGRVWYLNMPHEVWTGFISSITYLLRCIVDRGMEISQKRLPIRERTVKIGTIMDWGKVLPVHVAHEVCRMILLECPMLSDDDLKQVGDAFNVDVPEGGVVFSHCDVSGNNIMEKVERGDIPQLPQNVQPLLLKEK